MNRVPSTSLAFDLRLDHDRYLSPADRELHGILTVTARPLAGAPAVDADRPPRSADAVAEPAAGPGTGPTIATTGTGPATPGTGTGPATPATADRVPQVRIRIRTVAPTRVLSCRQVRPTVRELTGVPVDDRTVDHPTGSWGEERREYHLRLAVDGTGRPRGEDLLAARIDLVVDDVARTPPVAALVHWTDDLSHSSRTDPWASESSPSGTDEHHDDGDPPTVTGPLGRAVRLAAVAGDTRRLAELGLLVAGVDPVRTCRCGREAPPDARFCERCGAELDAAGPVST